MGLRVAALLLGLLVVPSSSPAQEPEPRAYSNAPVGMNFLVASYGYQWGNVVFDPSLPVEDVTANLNGAGVGYVRSFGLFGKSAKLAAILPYVWGSLEGLYLGEFARVERSGLGDSRLQLSVNLLGAPALRRREFATWRQRTILGASLRIAVPTGQYDQTKLVNLGTNRWSFRPEVGVSHAAGRWVLEGSAGLAFFTANDEYRSTSTLEQDPLGVLQGHVVYNVGPRLWLAADVVYVFGGRSTIDGVPRANRQENPRVSATASFPVRGGQSIKIAGGTGLVTRVGADFDWVLVGYQVAWGGR